MAWAYSTLGMVWAYSTTAGTSATPPILRPQWQTNTPTRGGSWETSRSGGKTFSRTRVSRASARRREAAAAAALASITVWGMSLGPLKKPQEKTPGREVVTGAKHSASMNLLGLSLTPNFWARLMVSGLVTPPTDRTTRSKISSCSSPDSVT